MTIKVGLIGAGVMGADHARILATAVSGGELVAVSDPAPERRSNIVEICRSVRAFLDPMDLIQDRSVDAVLAASPDETHGTLVHLSRSATGAAEKPTPSVAECLKVIEAERALGKRLVTIGYMSFRPGYVEMKRKLTRESWARRWSCTASIARHCAIVRRRRCHHELSGSRDRHRRIMAGKSGGLRWWRRGRRVGEMQG